ncbi:MAG: 2-hydroxychromene-2-carboxylate isomerase [Burkholderiaceae bacterium]|nr:2-hydroxychromene-2-carboxylate isomerase [Burkholderiaceae bacterium]
MTRSVEFWFDVGSPYSYLAYRALPAIAAECGARIDWRPMLLGAVFKATGNHSPVEVPAKGRWAFVDLQRWAQHIGTTFEMNPHFPINTLALMRVAVAMRARGEDVLLRYLEAVFEAIWCARKNMNDERVLAQVLLDARFDPRELFALAGDAAVKDRLKADTEEAVARGVFGAPTFFVADQMFWGQDRLDFVARALRAS